MELQLTERGFSKESSNGLQDFYCEQDSWGGNATDKEKSVYSRERIKFAVVIPSTVNRIENLVRVLDKLSYQDEELDIVVVCDGWHEGNLIDGVPNIPKFGQNVKFISCDKHEPGKEQPRNVGVRYLKNSSDADYVWFLDSDCLAAEDCLTAYREAYYLTPLEDKVMIGPYEWMAQGETELRFNLKNDPRWPLFNKYDPSYLAQHSLELALACFSGNLVWPIDEFVRVGGFWNELFMGRCEDGELGLRASAMGVKMCVVSDARAFHIGHAIDTEQVFVKNKIDVPKINERHSYVEELGLVVADEDGKRFDQICECGEQVNTIEYWKHKEECNA